MCPIVVWHPQVAANRAAIAVLLQADSATQKQLDLVRMTENSKRTLEQEVGSYRWAPQSCAAVANRSKQF
jgi:hypothetical protein